MSDVRKFISGLTSYLPIGQNKVRVAITAYNRIVFTDQQTWFLDAHNSFSSLDFAISRLPSEGLGRNAGAAMAWVGDNAFKGRLGDRPSVKNLIVLIATGNPDDFITTSAAALRNIGKLAVVAVGPDATAPELQAAATAPSSDNFLRVPDFLDLDNNIKFIYNLLCGVNCITE
uniref:VWFA domain-containing protein n=1 Tax=Ciona savignyi TaxID=51511 RepID=H2ZGN1_CIOSA